MGHRGQEPNESTDDAVWQDLVARLEGSTGPGPGAADPTSPATRPEAHVVRRPGTPETDEGRDGDGAALTDRERADAIFRNQPFNTSGPRDYSAPAEPDEPAGFVPAEPPPLGSGDPLKVLAWVGAAGGPIALLLVAMFWRSAPLGITLGILAVFLAGAGYLVTRLPKHRDTEDDGAEV